MQTSKFKLPTYQRVLNGACVAALAILTVTFFVAPQLLTSLRIPSHAPQTLGLLLGINCLGLIAAIGAARLKFTDDSFKQVVIGSTLFLCFSLAGVDLALVWKVYAEEYWQWSGLLGLGLPGIVTGLMGCQLLTDEKAGQALDEDQPSELDIILENDDDVQYVFGFKKPSTQKILQFAKHTAIKLLFFTVFSFNCGILASVFIITHNLTKEVLFNSENEYGILFTFSIISKHSYELFIQKISSTVLIFSLSFTAIIIISIPIAISMLWIGGKIILPETSKYFQLSDDERIWVDQLSHKYSKWLTDQENKPVSSMILFLLFIIIPFAMVFILIVKISSIIIKTIELIDAEILIFSSDYFIAFSVLILILLYLIIISGTIFAFIPVFRKSYLSLARQGVEMHPAVSALNTTRLLTKSIETGQLTHNSDLSPEGLHRLQLTTSLRHSLSYLKWILPAFALIVMIDTFWYRAWYEDHVRTSPVWTWQSQDYSYADAERVEILCETYRADHKDRARLRYEMTLPNSVQLNLHSNEIRRDLSAMAQVHEGVLRSGAPIIRTTEADTHDCRTLLIDTWGQERGEAAWSLLFEGHVTDG